MKEYLEIAEDMRASQFLRRIWKRYQEENTYSQGIKFDDTLEVVLQIGEQLRNIN